MEYGVYRDLSKVYPKPYYTQMRGTKNGEEYAPFYCSLGLPYSHWPLPLHRGAMRRKRSGSLNTPEMLAKKFHGKSQKRIVLQRFAEKARSCSKRRLRRYAFHVASWFACAPPHYIPGPLEMELLLDYLFKLGGGQLPGRLQKVLPQTLASLESMQLPGSALEEMRERLRKTLYRFRCCRSRAEVDLDSEAQEESEVERREEDEEGYEEEHAGREASAESCEVRAVEAVRLEETEEEVLANGCEDCDRLLHSAFSKEQARQTTFLASEFAAMPEDSAPPHLFRKMNDWSNMVNREKLAFLKKLQLASI